jgi:hypothetical protein
MAVDVAIGRRKTGIAILPRLRPISAHPGQSAESEGFSKADASLPKPNGELGNVGLRAFILRRARNHRLAYRLVKMRR